MLRAASASIGGEANALQPELPVCSPAHRETNSAGSILGGTGCLRKAQAVVFPLFPADHPAVSWLAHLRSVRLPEDWGPVLRCEGESCSPTRLMYHHIHVQDTAGEITSDVFTPFGAFTPDGERFLQAKRNE